MTYYYYFKHHLHKHSFPTPTREDNGPECNAGTVFKFQFLCQCFTHTLSTAEYRAGVWTCNSGQTPALLLSLSPLLCLPTPRTNSWMQLNQAGWVTCTVASCEVDSHSAGWKCAWNYSSSSWSAEDISNFNQIHVNYC